MQDLVQQGERDTWRRLAMIDNCTKVSRTLDDILMHRDYPHLHLPHQAIG